MDDVWSSRDGGGIVVLIHLVAAFAGLADILGAVFLIAVLWLVQAFMQRASNEFWWVGLRSGILMVGIAFWVSGQYLLTEPGPCRYLPASGRR